MNFKRIKDNFFQFGILKALSYSLVDLVRKLLDPSAIISYSQTGEDRIIASILGEVESGFYVDVGCNHPVDCSNTFALYKKGWTGISIDANEELILKHRKLRKRGLAISAVISDQEEEKTFTEFKDSFVSSLDHNHVNEWQKHREIKQIRQVNTIRLDSILGSNKVPHNFCLLTIDVEGHDFEVLRSLDFSLYRPQLIVIEMHGFDLLNPTRNKIFNYLQDQDYKLIGYIIMNGYFTDSKLTNQKNEVNYV